MKFKIEEFYGDANPKFVTADRFIVEDGVLFFFINEKIVAAIKVWATVTILEDM